jgi:hypothetical protein
LTERLSPPVQIVVQYFVKSSEPRLLLREVSVGAALVNANVTWTPHDEGWSVGLYGRNLADRRYWMRAL